MRSGLFYLLVFALFRASLTTKSNPRVRKYSVLDTSSKEIDIKVARRNNDKDTWFIPSGLSDLCDAVSKAIEIDGLLSAKNATNSGIHRGDANNANIYEFFPSTNPTSKPNQDYFPTAPLSSTDVLPCATVKIVRDPTSLKNVNASQPPVYLEAIPPGLRRYWKAVKTECACFNEKESKTVAKLLEYIINDVYEQYVEFEDTFRETFGIDYNNFSKKDRSVLPWLISFGSVNILRSIDIKSYCKHQASIDKSVKYLVDNNQIRFLAIILDQCPFLLKQKTFKYIVERNSEKEYLDLSILFTKMKRIDINAISGPFSLLKVGEEVSGLISIASSIVANIKNPENVFFMGVDRKETVLKFKTALSQLFASRFFDFKSFLNSEFFSIAHLFIDTGNAEALKQLLDVHPEMIHANGNNKSLLQINMSSSTGMKTAALLVEKNPSSVVALANQYQTPFFQAVFDNRMDYFDLFYPTLKSNYNIDVHGVPEGLPPISIVMIYGNREMLHKLATHFRRQKVAVNLRQQLEFTCAFLENASSAKRGTTKYRVLTLISHEIWLYLIDEAKIEVGPTATSKLSLLELAIIDRNPEIVRKILADPRTDVNRIYESDSFKGNCLLHMKGDLAVMKLLVEKGVKINIPITRLIIDNYYRKCDNAFMEFSTHTETISMYEHLTTYKDPAFIAYLQTLKFTDL